MFNDLCYVLKYDYSIEKFEIRESASLIYFLKKNKYIDLDLNIEEIINKYKIRIKTLYLYQTQILCQKYYKFSRTLTI